MSMGADLPSFVGDCGLLPADEPADDDAPVADDVFAPLAFVEPDLFELDFEPLGIETLGVTMLPLPLPLHLRCSVVPLLPLA